MVGTCLNWLPFGYKLVSWWSLHLNFVSLEFYREKASFRLAKILLASLAIKCIFPYQMAYQSRLKFDSSEYMSFQSNLVIS